MIRQFVLLAAIIACSNSFRVNNARFRNHHHTSSFMCSEEASPEVEEETPVVETIEAVTEHVDTPEVVEEVAVPAVEGFAKYEVGQEYEGTVLSAKAFGVFVDIENGQNALIPRSQLSRGSYEKLKSMVTDKSKDLLKVELIGVNAENQTISCKYLQNNRADITSLEGQDLSAKFYNATVISTHDFGIFAELDDFGVEGLVPASKLPDTVSKSGVKDAYKAGQQVTVKIEQLSIGDKKLVLSMDVDPSEGNPLSHISHDKWFQGIVQNVASFGLFVRPAGFDAVGLIHFSRVPKGLMNVLKRTSPVDASSDQSDIEQLFAAGDVVRCRVHSALDTSRKIELSMLPFRADADEDDEYVVEGRDPEEPEGKEGRGPRRNNNNQRDEQQFFDPEDTLLWWKGSPYVKQGRTDTKAVDEEIEVINESTDIVEGTWRRLFEVDMRKDADDFSSKVQEMELKELADDIGELNGLDEDIIDALGFGAGTFPTNKFGTFVNKDQLPAEWQTELEFFKDLENTSEINLSGLKGGKKGEQEEFERLLREVEAELAASASAKKSAAASEPALVAAGSDETADPKTADVEAVAEPVADEAPAPAE